MAPALDVQPYKPRSCIRQRHRPNISTESAEEWYRINAGIPFIEQILTELEEWFSVLTQTSSQMLDLVPSLFCLGMNIDLSSVSEMYAQDLPPPETLQQKLSRWEHVHMSKPANETANTSAKALKECDKLCFPNVYVSLQLACTLPVSSCDRERSGQCLASAVQLHVSWHYREQIVISSSNAHPLSTFCWPWCCSSAACKRTAVK